MHVLHVDTPQAYIDRYHEHPEELDLLFRELLIGVTEFFRDSAAFDVVVETLLKNLASKGADDNIRSGFQDARRAGSLQPRHPAARGDERAPA